MSTIFDDTKNQIFFVAISKLFLITRKIEIRVPTRYRNVAHMKIIGARLHERLFTDKIEEKKTEKYIIVKSIRPSLFLESKRIIVKTIGIFFVLLRIKKKKNNCQLL